MYIPWLVFVCPSLYSQVKIDAEKECLTLRMIGKRVAIYFHREL